MSGQYWGNVEICKNGSSCSYLAIDSCMFEHSKHVKDLAELRNKPTDEMRFWELCKVDYIEGVKEALEREVDDVNTCDSDGMTGLMWAVENVNLNLVRLLVAFPGIELSKRNHDQNTAGHLAVMAGQDMLEIMLSVLSKEDLELEDKNNMTPLDIALEIIDEDSFSTGSALMIIKALGKDPKKYLTPDVFFETKNGDFIYLYEEEERRQELEDEKLRQEMGDDDLDSEYNSEDEDDHEEKYRRRMEFENWEKEMGAHERAGRTRVGGYGCW